MKPLKVALCDDSKKDRDFFYNICKLVKERKDIEIKLKEYETGDFLLHDMEDIRILQSVDIVLLDINMPGRNGIEVAEKLREMEFDGEIIFITKSREHWRGAFDVKAINYIVKNEGDVENRFLDVFIEASEQALSKRDSTLLFSSIGEVRKVRIKTISHFEVIDHLVKCYYDGDSFEFTSSLAKIEEQLFGNEGFFRINRNCLVSISHIRQIENKNVVMLTGEKIPISSRKIKGLKEAMIKYSSGMSI